MTVELLKRLINKVVLWLLYGLTGAAFIAVFGFFWWLDKVRFVF